MAKRSAQAQAKLFSFNLESLLLSDESQGEQNDFESSSTESACKHAKQFKGKNSKPLPANKVKVTEEMPKSDAKDQNEEEEEIEDIRDISKFFGNVGTDFGKSMQGRKSRINNFTEAVISTYDSKLDEMVKRQDNEVKKFKEHAFDSIHEEVQKTEEEFKKLKLQEGKIVKGLEQQLKLFQKTATSLETFVENFNKVHKNFVQEFENLKIKHRNETLELKKSLGTDVTALQNKFLADSKKEEMQTIKKYLNTIYF